MTASLNKLNPDVLSHPRKSDAQVSLLSFLKDFQTELLIAKGLKELRNTMVRWTESCCQWICEARCSPYIGAVWPKFSPLRGQSTFWRIVLLRAFVQWLRFLPGRQPFCSQTTAWRGGQNHSSRQSWDSLPAKNCLLGGNLSSAAGSSRLQPSVLASLLTFWGRRQRRWQMVIT